MYKSPRHPTIQNHTQCSCSSKGLTALEMKEKNTKILSINIQIDLGGVELIEIETKKVSSLFHNLTFKCAGVG